MTWKKWMSANRKYMNRKGVKVNENIKKIAEHYGYGEQSLMLIEEMAELAQAINKFRRAGKSEQDAALDHIHEEIADVEVCLDQIKWLLGCEANVKMWKDIKTARQVKRIEAENDIKKAERIAERIRKLVKG